MFSKPLSIGAVLLLSTLSVWAQGTPDDNRVYKPSEEQLAAFKRQQEMLRHPTFVTLRLVSKRRYLPKEEPTDTPAPYKERDYIDFDLFMTQNSTEKFIMAIPAGSCYQCRPELMKDGEVIPYNNRRQSEIESEESGRSLSHSSSSRITLEPGREFGPQSIDLESWYDPLTPGRYQLVARKQFVRGGDWVVSNPVYFEVIPRTPGGPIPKGVTIELTPEGVQPKTDGKPYQLGSEVFITFLVRNKSDQPLKINVIDRDYSNRPELFKDGKLVPYLEQAVPLIKSKEENPRLVQVVNDFYLDPQTGTWPDGIDLKKWYGPLSPGSYRLVLRHRFEIDGPWSDESKPLLFEVSANKRN